MKFLALIALMGVRAEFEKEDGVIVGGADNFDDILKASGHVLVEFYAPWCGHCKSLTPEYASAAEQLAKDGSEVLLVKVDATVHGELAKEFGVGGYPTLKWFKGSDRSSPVDYKGGRKSDEIVSWVTKKSVRGAANSFILALLLSHAYSFSVPSHQRTTTTPTTTMMMMSSSSNSDSSPSVSRRDAFLTVGAGVIGATSAFVASTPAIAAAPKIYTLESGIKYAITKEATTNTSPYTGDIVAIEYTGYLTSGQIFDATHSEGKSNALLFKLGTGSVIPGLDIMVANMKVGQKVQAIIPPNLAYADKGVCLEDGECLIKPGSTLVYDIILKKSSVPPP